MYEDLLLRAAQAGERLNSEAEAMTESQTPAQRSEPPRQENAATCNPEIRSTITRSATLPKSENGNRLHRSRSRVGLFRPNNPKHADSAEIDFALARLQGENAQEIAKLAGDLRDKLSASLVDLNGVSEKITGALAAHNDAVKRLSFGRGNALSIGERIRSLGVKTKRPIPTMLVDGAPIVPEIEASDENNLSENGYL